MPERPLTLVTPEPEEAVQPLKSLVDNRLGNSMLETVRRLMRRSKMLDVATGYFQIGALLAFDGDWQQLQRIRLLMGNELTRSTKLDFAKALADATRNGIETAQMEDDWRALSGLKSFRQAIVNQQLQARIYAKAKFHAKMYQFTTGGDFNHALVGSSNFTRPGLTQNLELNVLFSGNSEWQEMKAWFQEVWTESLDLTPELLAVIDPHLHEYGPFEIYLQAMREYFSAHETDDTGWEQGESKLYLPVLAQYQRDAYNDLMHMAKQFGGGLLCDGVGLGKTFVALMLIERAIHDKEKVLIIAPKAAIPSVWKRNLLKYFPDDYDPSVTDDIRVIPHTDFGREGGISYERIEHLRKRYGTIIVDEAHHFRVPNRNRSKKLKALTKDKRVFLLTATPVNNGAIDLYNLINYISQDRARHFQSVGVPNLRNWFGKVMSEADLEQGELFEDTSVQEFLKHVIVQRSRKYIKSLEKQEDEAVKFPARELPEIIDYSLAGVYGQLLPHIIRAFDTTRGRLKLVIYETEKFKTDDKDKTVADQQSQVVGLIRTMLLKRLESSQVAFLASIESLLLKHIVLLRDLQPMKHEVWITEHQGLYDTLVENLKKRTADRGDEEEDDLPLSPAETRSIRDIRADLSSFGKNEPVWTKALEGDVDVLTELLEGLYKVTDPEQDNKLQALLRHIHKTPRLMKEKFIIFSEFKDTARYLEEQLKRHFNPAEIVEVDSGRNVNNREDIIKRFAPYYNCETPAEIEKALQSPVRVLVSTDVLSEGLNLQDANIIINYDLHWNPVRLMQRIGRVDRRMDPNKPVRYAKVFVYNFLPPKKELDDVLGLYKTLSGKLLVINRLLGIEAPILGPDDPTGAMDFFQNLGDSTMSTQEKLRLTAHGLEQNHPELWHHTEAYPNRIYSGKLGSGKKLFLAYCIPTGVIEPGEVDPPCDVRWFLVDRETKEIVEDLQTIHDAICCIEGTSRNVTSSTAERTRLRKLVEEEKVEPLLFRAGITGDFKPELLCWMEIN